MTPWPDKLLKKWDELTADEKKLFIRQADVYAAYLAYTDHEIGRVIRPSRTWASSTTRSSFTSAATTARAPRAPHRHAQRGRPVQQHRGPGRSPAKNVLRCSGEATRPTPTWPWRWTWAFDTPFQWTKQVASHFGGTRQGMAISWPGHITDMGGIRNQFHHVIDIVPTILEACGIRQPGVVERDRAAADRRREHGLCVRQGQCERADAPQDTILRDVRQPRHLPRWLVCEHDADRPPWDLGGTPNQDVANSYTWELYDLTKDWTQSNDLAKSNPEKLRELQKLFMEEAHKYNVLPLDNAIASRLVTPRPSVTAGRDEFTYTGGSLAFRSATRRASSPLRTRSRRRSTCRPTPTGSSRPRGPLSAVGVSTCSREARVPMEYLRSETRSLGIAGGALGPESTPLRSTSSTTGWALRRWRSMTRAGWGAAERGSSRSTEKRWRPKPWSTRFP